MDLSFNKLNKVNQKKLSFQGVKGDYDAKSKLVYKFTAPPYNPNKEQVFLQIVPLKNNPKMGGYIEPNERDIKDYKFDENGLLEISHEDIEAPASNAFAYRYKIVNTLSGSEEFRTDGFKSINIKGGHKKMNILDYTRGYAVTPKTGLMRHSFLDSDVILDTRNQMLTQDKEFVRNHFNKLGGSIKGLTYLLKNTNELNPYRYIMTTPDIGVDDVSSHKYWPNNQYQCSNIDDFKEFNYELFKRGKGYITDGAFASQGLQSPMVQHVFKWGEDSPFFNMLKIEDSVELGILPNLSSNEYENAMAHIGVRLVNSPKSIDYNKSQPTYIQLFDDRLTSKELLYSNELIKAYDKNPEDHYEITNHMDSVQPFYFELPADSEKIKAFKKSSVIMLKDLPDYEDFLKFKNFSIVKKSDVANASFWDGNTDIVKMNFSYGETPEKAAGVQDARNYILGVATFWTEAIQSDFILNLAKASDSEKKTIARNNELSKEQYKNIEENYFSMNSLVLQQNKKVKDYVKNFPYQSLETSPELSAIFAQPKFNKEVYAGGFDKKVENIVEKAINDVVPNRYKNDKDYKTFVTKAYANTIIKTLLAGSFEPNSVDDNGRINTNILRKVNLRSILPSRVSSVEAERVAVVNYVRSTLNEKVLENLKKEIKKELNNVSLADFEVAEQIVLQAKGGLNWRFDAAKDIGNLDSIRAGKKTFEEIWNEKKGVETFWGDFIERIRECNPSSYIINEITSLDDFVDWDSKGLYDSFDSNLSREFEAKAKKSEYVKGKYEERATYAKEMEYLAKTSSTTDSNYGKYFSTLAGFMGLDLEQGKSRLGDQGNVENLKEATESFMKYGHPNTVILSHVFFENHDKPRALHLMPLNSHLFFEKKIKESDDMKIANALFAGSSFDYNRISPKGLAVAQAMTNTLNELSYNEEEKGKLKHAISLLAQGKKDDDSIGSFRRSQAFGVLPYEVTIRDVFKKSGIKYNDKDVLNFHYTMMKGPMEKQDRLWQVTCALLGVPTLYGGMEFAQTGFETPSKNIHVGNRNQILHELKNEKGYKEYYDKIQATSLLHQEPNMSALRNGFPVVLPIQTIGEKTYENIDGIEAYVLRQLSEYFTGHDVKDTFDKLRKMIQDKRHDELHEFIECELYIAKKEHNHNVLIDNLDKFEKYFEDVNKTPISLWPLYRYDELGSKTISVISNCGINNGIKNIEVDDIKIARNTAQKCVLPEGTILKRKIYADGKYKDDGINYVVKDGAITSPNGKIKIVDTVSTFYVPKAGI